MKEHLVSIITPCYNSERYISDTINAVLNQTYQNWEMIIIDDCSTDKSLEIIKFFSKSDNRIRYIEMNKNMGAGHARNKGIKLARGKFYAFLDSDDLWCFNKLESQIRFMIDKEITFSYTAYNFITENNQILNKYVKAKYKINYFDLLKSNNIGCLTVIYDAEKINKNQKIYMSTIRSRQDLSLWLKILKNINYAYGLDEILSTYRIRTKSISSNKIKAIYYQWKLYRNIEKFSFTKSIYFLIFYLYFGTIKYFKQL